MVSSYIRFFKKLFNTKKQVHRNYKTQEFYTVFTSIILHERKLKMCMKCGTYHTVSGFW